MKLLKRVLSPVLTATIVAGMVPATLAVDTTYSYTAKLDKETISPSDKDQKIYMTLNTDKAVTLDSLDARVQLDAPLKATAVTSNVLNPTDQDYNLDYDPPIIAYATADAENVTTAEIITIEITVPANTAAGKYRVGFSDVGMSKDYGTPWVTGQEAYTNLTISNGEIIKDYNIKIKSAIGGGVVANRSKAAEGTEVILTVKPDSSYMLNTISVVDENSKSISLKKTEENEYIFIMPDSSVEIHTDFKKEGEQSQKYFRDVSNNDYYYDAVAWAVNKGITAGTSDSTFTPNQACTRAQIVTFLWRAAGSPEPTRLSTFRDVPSNSYYAKAVAWAVEKGITTGTSASTFGPNNVCTRAQAVTFLCRAIGTQGKPSSEFSDVPSNAYYAGSVAWAVANGVTGGVGNGQFAPNRNCTRAQIVTFLYRAYQKQ